jgi:hypothetical protein
MAEFTWITKLNKLQTDLGELITTVSPDNDGEWEALEKMTAAHKQLRSIDRTPLSQQKLPLSD